MAGESQLANSKREEFEMEHKIISMFIDSAKQFVALSTGVVTLTVAFLKDFLHREGQLRPSWHLKAAWLALFAAIASGALYQYVAVKYLDAITGNPPGHPFRYLSRNPGYVYGLMLVTFCVGALLLLLSVWRIYS